MSNVAAFVIAGGQSSRMGRDKAFLELDARTLLERALALARSVAGDVTIVGRSEKFASYGAVIEDLYPGQGPLAGIHAALTASSSELNLMLGVDTPFLEPRFLRYLIQEAEKSRAVVTVPVTRIPPESVYRQTQTLDPSTRVSRPGENAREPSLARDDIGVDQFVNRSSVGQAQPLCAVYRREFAAVAEEALRQRRNNIVPLFAKVTTREIGDSELRKMAFDARMFDNLNTPEEWNEACKRAQT